MNALDCIILGCQKSAGRLWLIARPSTLALYLRNQAVS